MTALHRLSAESEIRFLLKTGTRREGALFSVAARRNTLVGPRFVYIVSKAVTKRAVIRNKLRRRTREWFRKRITPEFPSLDIAIIFKKPAAQCSAAQLYEDLASVKQLLDRR